MTSSPSDYRRGILAMCTCMALFLVQDSFTKLASARMPTAQIICLRGMIACAMLMVWILVTQPRAFRYLADRGMIQGGVRAAFDALASFTYLWALFNLPLPNVSAINLSGPLLLTALAIVFLGEKVHWRRWIAIVVGLVGVVIIIQPTGSAFNWYSVLALFGTFCGAARDVLTRTIRLEIPTVLLTLVSTGLATAGAGVGVLIQGWPPVAWGDVLMLGAAGLFLITGYQFMILSLRITEASVVAPFRYTSILWALLFGYIFWGDVPDPLAWVGIATLVGSGLYLLHRDRLGRRIAAGSAPAP